jgi:hypothetical protein
MPDNRTPPHAAHRYDAPMLVSRHLGAISSDYTETTLGAVKIDINVDEPAALDQHAIDEIDRMIDELDALRSAALASFAVAIHHDGSTPADFWQFHHDEVDSSIARDRFVASLELVRAGFYPGESELAILDFRVRGPRTDQLLVAKFARDKLACIAWES